MKRYFLTFIILLLTIGFTFAQSKKTRFQQIEAAKIAYITKHLELSPAEAQKFFPIYNEYREEIQKITYELRGEQGNLRRQSLHGLEYDSKILECKKKYRNRFATVISASKASRFFEVEREFRQALFKELENRKLNQRRR